MSEQKDIAYWERNQLVAALSKIFPANLAKHDPNDKEWDNDWRTIVVIYLPLKFCFDEDYDKFYFEITRMKVGGEPCFQMTWHIHDFDIPMFDHLKYNPENDYYWDGHSTEEKYKRLRLLQPRKVIKEDV